jgi:hypothetical protein
MPLTSAGAPLETSDNLSTSFRVPLTSAGAPVEQAETTAEPTADAAEHATPVEQPALQEPAPPGSETSVTAAAAPQATENVAPQQPPAEPPAAAKEEPVVAEPEQSSGTHTSDTTAEEQPSSVKDILASYAPKEDTGSQRPIHDIISAYETGAEKPIATAEPSADQVTPASEPAPPPPGKQDTTPAETSSERSEMDALFATTATEALPAEEQPVSPPRQPARTTIQRDHLKDGADEEEAEEEEEEEEEPAILFELTIPFPEMQDFKKISPLYWIGIAGFLLILFVLTISIWFLISFPEVTGNPVGKTVQTTTYQAGEDVAFADVRWKLVGASQKENPADTAAGSLVLVRMEVENLTDEAVSFQPFTLIDAEEHVLPPSADPTLTSTIPPEEQCLQTQLQPGQVQTCQLLFQPSPDAKDLKVQVADMDPSTEETALIDPGLAPAE